MNKQEPTHDPNINDIDADLHQNYIFKNDVHHIIVRKEFILNFMNLLHKIE